MAEFGESEWAQEWGAVIDMQDDSGASFKVPGPPWHFSDCDVPSHTQAGVIGQDNWQIFSELGISREQYDALRKKGVVFARK